MTNLKLILKNMQEVLKQKKIIIPIIAGVILVVVFIVAGTRPKPQPDEPADEILPKSQIIPTVDASVRVDLTSQNNKEVVLTIEQIPAGTASIEYELSYLASGGLPKGVIGTIPINGEDNIERKITLGTCSSGRCVYDQGVETIKVSLKFDGDYGSRLFEKEFEI